jgi:hypothetical protein
MPADAVFEGGANQTEVPMRKLVICTATALVFSTGLALAQGSGAAGDIGSGSLGARQAPAAEPTTVGQGTATQTAPAPKAAKKTAKKKSTAPN